MKSNNPLKIALLASGNGTNAENLMKYARDHDDIEVVGLISDQSEARALERAKTWSVPTAICPVGKKSKEEQELEMIEVLRHWGADWICLCGYMRLLSSKFLQSFPLGDSGLARVLNIHPSLLPAFPGLDAYEKAFHYGVKVAGATVHLVDNGMDTGPIILQRSFNRHDGDGLEDFKQRGLALEYELYREALDLIRHGRLHPLKKGTSWYVCTDLST